MKTSVLNLILTLDYFRHNGMVTIADSVIAEYAYHCYVKVGARWFTKIRNLSKIRRRSGISPASSDRISVAHIASAGHGRVTASLERRSVIHMSAGNR